MEKGYNKNLADEWIDWVETPNPKGTREKEIFPFIKEWVDKIKPKLLCDIGCGQGSCSALLGKEVKYVGVDASDNLINRAKRLYSEPNKKFIKGNAYNIPLGKKFADAILSVWVWSHLKNLDLASKEISRVLKFNGRFLIITANPETYDERKTFYKNYTIKDNLLTGDFDLGNGKVLTKTNLYLHSKEDIKNAIKQAGLEINYIKRMGKDESSKKGLYLIIEGFLPKK